MFECEYGFEVAKWRNLGVVDVYAPPSWPLVTFERALYQLSELSLLPLREYLIFGDFYAKAILWSASRNDARGEMLMKWAASVNLCHLKQGDASTCVRWQGGVCRRSFLGLSNCNQDNRGLESAQRSPISVVEPPSWKGIDPRFQSATGFPSNGQARTRETSAQEISN